MATYEVCKVKLVRHDLYVCKIIIVNDATRNKQQLLLPPVQLLELHNNHQIAMDGGSTCYCSDIKMQRLVEQAARSVNLI